MRRLVMASAVIAVCVGAPVAVAGAPVPLSGEWVVVVNNPADGPDSLWLIRPDGSDFHTVSDGTMSDYGGALSPDGTALAIVANDGTIGSLWLANTSGAERIRLTPGYAASPAWTPDGRSIVYTDNVGVRVIGRDGQGDREITSVPGARTVEVAVSPDGATVVFSAQVEATIDLYAAPLAGGAAVRLTTEGGAEPSFSPDGDQVVFRTFRVSPDGVAEGNIWVMAPDGTGQTNLIPSDHNDFHPSWSPDGTRVVFEQVHNESGFPILVHDLATGTNAVLLENAEGAADRFRSPTWTAVTLAPIDMPVVTTTTAVGDATTAATTTSAAATTTAAGGSDGGDRGSGPGLGLALGAAGLIVGFASGMAVGRRRALATLPPPPAPADLDH